MSKHAYLAFDLGAESGRALIGHFEAGVLSVEEIPRFANEPLRYNGELHWDVARLWREMQRAMSLAAASNAAKLEGIGLDTWGVDYALLGEGGTLLENPHHYRASSRPPQQHYFSSEDSRRSTIARWGFSDLQPSTVGGSPTNSRRKSSAIAVQNRVPRGPRVFSAAIP